MRERHPARMAVIALFGVLGIALAACSGGNEPGPNAEAKPLEIYAAASLTDVGSELSRLFAQQGGATCRDSFGSTAMLARQIRDGAPADVLLSADRKWADWMVEQGLSDGKPVVVARNRLVCIAPRDGLAQATASADLRQAAFARIALADQNVPAGDYARAALTELGLLEELRPRLTGQTDVRAVLRAVEMGEADAGFVYATDAETSSKVRILFEFAADSHPPIAYYAVAIKGGRGAAYLEFLRSREAQDVLSRQGFLPGGGP